MISRASLFTAVVFLAIATAMLEIMSPTGLFILEINGSPSFETFDGRTTDFGNLSDFSCVDDVVLERTLYGRIEFLEGCLNLTDYDLDNYVEIGKNSIGIDVSALPSLNVFQKMYIYNITFDNPEVLQDGRACENCSQVELNGSTLSFVARPRISLYSAQEGAVCDNDSICESGSGENWSNCRHDCICNNDSSCESGLGETWENCRHDCICNFDSSCEPGAGENRTNCPSDCETCNKDGVCEPDLGEDRDTCYDDCSVCDMDQVCDSIKGENRVNCQDCLVCDNNTVCEPLYNEDPENCPGDCPPDTVPPQISSVYADEITFNSSLAHFTVDEEAECWIRYGRVSGVYTERTGKHASIGDTSIRISSLSAQKRYFYAVFCNDTAGNMAQSLERDFTTENEPLSERRPKYETFNGSTTEFDELVYFECLYEVVLEKTRFGKIKFLEDCMNFTRADLDDYVFIQDNLIFIDTLKLPYLNASARLFIYNLDLKDPGILKDGEPCSPDDCSNIKYSDGTLSFDVLGFGQYQAREKINMSVWSSADEGAAKINQTITFYAEFRYLGRIAIHDGVNCTIKFPQEENSSERSMEFDYHKNYYKRADRFSSPGNFTYKVTCNAKGLGAGKVVRESYFFVSNKSVCGDGICHKSLGENCSTCVSDCGECPKKNCTASWLCSDWGECIDGTQTRLCTLQGECLNVPQKPAEKQECSGDLCRNGELDPSETGIDCGGPCPPCANCSDWIQNQGEEGIDCGGPCPENCSTCSDGVKNCHKKADGRCIWEDDIDCGGPCPDCPSCSDGRKNQGEEGIDCGGPCSPCMEQPRPVDPPKSNSFSWALIIISLAAILIAGGGVAFYYSRPDVVNDVLKRFRGIGNKGSESLRAGGSSPDGIPKQTLENYILQNLKIGYNPRQLKQSLISSGWDVRRVSQAMDAVMGQIWGPQADRLLPVVLRMNLRRPDRVYAMLVKRGYKPFVAKMAVQKALEKRRSPGGPGTRRRYMVSRMSMQRGGKAIQGNRRGNFQRGYRR